MAKSAKTKGAKRFKPNKINAFSVCRSFADDEEKMDEKRRKLMHNFYNKLYHIHVEYAGLNLTDHERSAAFVDAIDSLANAEIADAPDEDRWIFRTCCGALMDGIEKASYERGDL